jgi:hypothetical protein
MANTRKTVHPKAKANPEPKTAETPEWGFAFGGQALERIFPGYDTFAATLGNPFESVRLSGLQAFSPDDFADLGKENLDAVYASGEAAAKGVENLRKNLESYAHHTFERNVQTSASLLKCTDFQQAAELQLNYCRDFLGGFFQESAEFMKIATKSSEQALAPLNSRAQAVYSRFSTSSNT